MRDLPTSFGPVSFRIAAAARSSRVVVALPPASPGSLRLRLRLPDRERIVGVSLGGRPYRRFDAVTCTIDLSGLSGRVGLTVALG